VTDVRSRRWIPQSIRGRGLVPNDGLLREAERACSTAGRFDRLVALKWEQMMAGK
jgi:hypothetical protein